MFTRKGTKKVPQTVTTLNSWRCIREKLPQTVTTLNSWRRIREKVLKNYHKLLLH